MQVIVPAMEQAGVRRLILMSAFGVGASSRDAPLIPRLFFRTLLREVFADKLAAEGLVRNSSLEWTLVYPVMLTNGPLTEKYRVGERLQLHGMSKISRADVAHFILEEAERSAFVRKTAVISY
jgi:putative NADH-flavin reductase